MTLSYAGGVTVPSTKQLLADLEEAEAAVDEAREAIITEIKARLGDMTPYAFATASGINRGNFYNLLVNGKWNSNVVLQALDLLGTPIKDSELKRKADENGKRK